MLILLQDLRSIQSWPLWTRLFLMGLAFGAAFVFQIPLERDWPGEPFLLFLFVVIGTTPRYTFGAFDLLTSSSASQAAFRFASVEKSIYGYETARLIL